MITNNDIGAKAGTIWKLLSCRESMTIREIGEYTHLKDSLISIALGWLAKENKISISETNEVLKISLKQSVSDIYY